MVDISPRVFNNSKRMVKPRRCRFNSGQSKYIQVKRRSSRILSRNNINANKNLIECSPLKKLQRLSDAINRKSSGRIKDIYISFVTDKILNYKIGGKMEIQLNTPISSYADAYHVSCLSSYYPIALTQNELINFPVEILSNTIKGINSILNKFNRPILEVVEMIDHTLYKNDLLCFIVHKTFAMDRQSIDKKQNECLSTALLGLCKPEAINKHREMVSAICLSIEKKIKDYNLNSNNAFKRHEDFKLSSDNIKFIRASRDKAEVDTVSIKSEEIQSLDKDYYPFIDVDILIDEFYQSDDKLLILHGEPGVGKSKLSAIITHVFSNSYDSNVVMYNGKLHNNPVAWQCLEDEIEMNNRSEEKTLVIIDDLEPAHMNRTDTNLEGTININSFFTNLLTILDGVLGNGVKVIITTNYILKSKLDAPLYRPGRLFDSLYLRPLTKEEALRIIRKNKLSKSKIDEFKKLKKENVFQSEVAQFISDSNKKITKSYYKEPNKQATSSKSSKIGF